MRVIMASCESKGLIFFAFFLFPTLSQSSPKMLPTEPVFIRNQILYNEIDLKNKSIFKESEVINMAKNTKQTSRKVASKASKILRDGRYSKTLKSVAGSALSQTRPKKK